MSQTFRVESQGDTVVLSTDKDGICALIEQIQVLATGKIGTVALGVLTLEVPDKSRGLYRSGSGFILALTTEDWEDVWLRVVALHERDNGHQYPLDYLGIQSELQLIVSMNE